MSDETKRAEVTEKHRQMVAGEGAWADWVLDWIRLGSKLTWKTATTEEWNRQAQLIADAEARGARRGRAKALEEVAALLLHVDPRNAALRVIAARIRALAAKETTRG